MIIPALLTGLQFGLTSCNPYMDLNKGIVHGGFMSKNQAFAGSITTATGVKAKWSMVGSDSTEVPIAITNAVGTAVTVKNATRGLINRQDNDAKQAINASNNAVKVKAIEATPVPPTVTQPGQVVTPPFFPPK